uniref:Uncharacterized protein n=1 Tax=Rhizophagus irregularis (strain DAOM 181602 / DAOM 197198 / MUCL 43194) TaxID=747089 RepID=U9TBV9_RHIID
MLPNKQPDKHRVDVQVCCYAIRDVRDFIAINWLIKESFSLTLDHEDYVNEELEYASDVGHLLTVNAPLMAPRGLLLDTMDTKKMGRRRL